MRNNNCTQACIIFGSILSSDPIGLLFATNSWILND